MNELVYPRERTLGDLILVFGLLIWLGLLVGTLGLALIWVAFGFVVYLFAQSKLIAHVKGNGVELSQEQFPDLYAQFTACCDRLGMQTRPQVYILNGNGGLNAFATIFLGTQFVVLLSDVVDAMDKHADGVRFYIGHELGHLRMNHLGFLHLLRWPALWLPLLGAAYSRARESTCDRHGLACSGSPEGAARALAALSAGAARWENLNVTHYLRQANHASGFWMSFHELTAGYPWLTKRAARVMDTQAPMPARNIFAYAGSFRSIHRLAACNAKRNACINISFMAQPPALQFGHTAFQGGHALVALGTLRLQTGVKPRQPVGQAFARGGRDTKGNDGRVDAPRIGQRLFDIERQVGQFLRFTSFEAGGVQAGLL